MIKKWKLFLESNDDFESEFKHHSEELKKALIKSCSRFFIGEHLLRSTGENVDEFLAQGVDIILIQILDCFNEIVSTKNFDEEIQDVLMDYLYDAAKSCRSVMIKQSFKEGISKLVDEFTKLMIDHKKKMDSEGEEWKQPKEVDEKDLSKSEIEKRINDVLDNIDNDPKWKEKIEFLRNLPNYLKESVTTATEKQEFESACREVAEILVKYCELFFK
jgi:hypothetical protein